MIDQTEILLECAKHLWQYRAELEHVWPTPDTQDALDFAVTEAAEAIDADLRLKEKYARNRDKSLCVEDELADCLMMLLTALGKDEPLEFGGKPEYVTLQGIMVDVAYAAFTCRTENDPAYPYMRMEPWHVEAYEAIDAILSFPNMDLPNRLIVRLERIKAKQIGNRLPEMTGDEVTRITIEAQGITSAMLGYAGSHE